MEVAVRAGVPAAQEIAAGDWVIRVSGGPTKRVNSASPVVPGATIAPVLHEAERIYRAAGQAVRFRLTPLADASVDRDLEARGFDVLDVSWTMVAPLEAGVHDAAVRFGAPDAAWQHAHAAAAGWDVATAAAHAPLLARLPTPLAMATLIEDGQPIAVAGATIAGGVAHLFDVATLAEARGRGAARRVVCALLAWAADHAADAMVLQVLADNMPARHLYASLGFVDAYPYHYRVSR